MMEGFLKHYADGAHEIYSAGVEAHGLNSRAVAVMQEAGIDISEHSSDLVTQYLNQGIDSVITVCDHAAQLCPVFPERTETHHHSFPDPAKATGSEEEIMAAFRSTRDAIRTYAHDFLLKLA